LLGKDKSFDDYLNRSEIIKMSPVVAELGKQEIECFILHIGQHYSLIWIK